MSCWLDRLPRPQYASLQRISTRQSWFHVYALRPNIYALYEPYQYEEVISYLLVGSQKSLLIDTGLGIGNIEVVVRDLTSTPLIVINTHTHHDHIGDNWRFASSLIGVRCAFTEKNDDELLRDAQSEVQDGAICEAQLPEGFNRQAYRIRPFQFTSYVSDGDLIDLGDGQELRVIFTPGHTPDSISLLDTSSGLLFVGDTFYLGPIFLYRPETNLADYIESLEKLVDIVKTNRVELVAPAHNVPNVEPRFLTAALAAIKRVVRGEVTAKKTDDGLSLEYDFGGFSFVRSASTPLSPLQ